MYSKTTNHIKITVEPSFLDEHSTPEDDHYVFSYHITIENTGHEEVQLHSRYWSITDSNGKTKEVQGEGVIGEQPMLGPGDSYEYVSGAPLNAPSGIMVGSYQMKKKDGNMFIVDIPAFSLDSPYHNSVLN
jgi:ApaG protein